MKTTLTHNFFLSSVSRNRRLEALNSTTFNSSLNTAVETGMLQCRKHVPMTLDSRKYILAILPGSIDLINNYKCNSLCFFT